MQKNLGQVLERVRSLEEDSVELRTTNEELRILEKNSISKIASLSSDNVDLTKQLLSLRTISLALNKQLTDQNARNKYVFDQFYLRKNQRCHLNARQAA